MTLKPYPTPNPNVDRSRSRFASGTVDVPDEKGGSVKDAEGNAVQQDVLRAAEPECPDCRFVYDPVGNTGSFVNNLNKDGGVRTKKAKRIAPYIPSPDVVELVRLAQILQRPVLIKGEPGSGKTQLARAVAYEWYGDEYKKHFFEWYVKSTSKAVDGLYTFDHISRLRNAQLRKKGNDSPDEDIRRYREFGPMGKAFLTSTEEEPSVLLIDEIDKADIDFPNDLLLELDQSRFIVPETGEEIETRWPPVIFITSNDEKELPEAFLRRCLFMYIEFPREAQLREIIKAHIPGLMKEQDAFVNAVSGELTEEKKEKPIRLFVEAAIARFYKLRDEIKNDPNDNKRVSTSEMLDWLRAYHYDMANPAQPKSEELAKWIDAFVQSRSEGLLEETVKQGTETLPFYYQAILKTKAAVNRRDQARKTTAQ